MGTSVADVTFCGKRFRAGEVELVREVVDSCGGLSRIELARTVCELLQWTRPSGGLKARECWDFLERLEEQGLLRLPQKRVTKPAGSRTRIPRTAQGDWGPPLCGELREVEPLTLELVRSEEQRLLFRELVGRYHYLGHAVPFGAHLRYLIQGQRQGEPVLLGCLQFSSPAWRMAARERWVGWDEATRQRNLQRVVNNSRFLILPWVELKNLASAALGRAARRVARDWSAQYGVVPLLLETLVDRSQYFGGCYRAANWIEVGVTAGRGRMDREHRRHDAAPKTVLLYPLVRDAARLLREG